MFWTKTAVPAMLEDLSAQRKKQGCLVQLCGGLGKCLKVPTQWPKTSELRSKQLPHGVWRFNSSYCPQDFPYDDDPMPGLLADERNLDFPLEKACKLQSSVKVNLGAQMQWDVLVMLHLGLRLSISWSFSLVWFPRASTQKRWHLVSSPKRQVPLYGKKNSFPTCWESNLFVICFYCISCFCCLITIDAPLSFTLYSCAFGRCPLEVSCRT